MSTLKKTITLSVTAITAISAAQTQAHEASLDDQPNQSTQSSFSEKLESIRHQININSIQPLDDAEKLLRRIQEITLILSGMSWHFKHYDIDDSNRDIFDAYPIELEELKAKLTKLSSKHLSLSGELLDGILSPIMEDNSNISPGIVAQSIKNLQNLRAHTGAGRLGQPNSCMSVHCDTQPPHHYKLEEIAPGKAACCTIQNIDTRSQHETSNINALASTYQNPKTKDDALIKVLLLTLVEDEKGHHASECLDKFTFLSEDDLNYLSGCIAVYRVLDIQAKGNFLYTLAKGLTP